MEVIVSKDEVTGRKGAWRVGHKSCRPLSCAQRGSEEAIAEISVKLGQGAGEWQGWLEDRTGRGVGAVIMWER